MKKILIACLVLVILIGAAFAFVMKPKQPVLTEITDTSKELFIETPAEENPAVSLADKGSVSIATLGTDRFVVDGNGYTLYVNTGDELSGTTAPMCDAVCEATWRPYYFDGAQQYEQSKDPLLARINIFTRADGKMQYALGKKPLYRYSGDKKVGDRLGAGAAANGWILVRP